MRNGSGPLCLLPMIRDSTVHNRSTRKKPTHSKIEQWEMCVRERERKRKAAVKQTKHSSNSISCVLGEYKTIIYATIIQMKCWLPYTMWGGGDFRTHTATAKPLIRPPPFIFYSGPIQYGLYTQRKFLISKQNHSHWDIVLLQLGYLLMLLAAFSLLSMFCFRLIVMSAL